MAQDTLPVRVLVVDDDDVILESCRRILEHRGYLVDVASDPFSGRDRALRGGYDLVLLDVRMPQLSGLEILAELRERRTDLEVIVISGYAAVDDAVLAVKLGAFDYLPKPFTLDEFRGRIDAALAHLRQRRAAPVVSAPRTSGHLVGSSPAMAAVHETIARLAGGDQSVLISGESGTGKELAARAIHAASGRRERPLVTLDCAALAPALVEGELFGQLASGAIDALDGTPGLLALADHGTLFLDEIEALPPSAQQRLGTLAQTIDVRIIAALTDDPSRPAVRNRLDPGLLQHLAGATLALPALRDRSDDIPDLLRHFLLVRGSPNVRRPSTIAPAAMAALQRYRWPGNVRELRALTEQLVVAVDGETVQLRDLPVDIARDSGAALPAVPRTFDELQQQRRDGRERLYAEFERSFVLESLRRNDWSVSRAAREAGVLRHDFAGLLRKHRLRAMEIE